MIRALTGKLIEVTDDSVVIDVHGVGYLVATPVLANQFTAGQIITLHTYLAVRETALDLYGFPTKVDLQVFELLLGIPKVGPKSALQILCRATPSLLTEATHKNDATYLHKLSGIGKKTCQNIVQHLQSKLEQLPSATIPAHAQLNATQSDAIDALVSLGYDATTARETILQITDDAATVNSLVTTALKQIK